MSAKKKERSEGAGAKKHKKERKSKKYRSCRRKSQASQKKFPILHGKKGSVLPSRISRLKRKEKA